MDDLELCLRPKPRRRFAVIAVLLLHLIVIAFLIAGAVAVRGEYERGEGRKSRLQAVLRTPPPLPPRREDQEQQARWESLRAEQRFSWYPVFRSLERASDENIELLEFVPDKRARQLVLRGEAVDMKALKAYLDRLEQQQGFQDVYLAHQKNKMRGSLRILAFEIRASLVQ